MSRTTHRLKGWALTPIHIGDGQTWTPDGFRLAAGLLERFDPPAVISAMPDELRGQYIKALQQGGLKQAQDLLQKTARPEHVRERILVSVASKADVEHALQDPHRKGEIRPFVRSGESPILPGSTLKGALRTAWLAACSTPQMKSTIEKEARSTRIGKTGQLSDRLHQTVFDFASSKTDQDPLRDVAVADCRIGDRATLIDKVQILNLKGDGPVAAGSEGGIQIHVERLASLADRGVFTPGELAVEIATLEKAGRDQRANLALQRSAGAERAMPLKSPDFAELRAACNAHHVPVWFAERDRFYQGLPTAALLDEMLRAFGFPVEGEPLRQALDAAGAWLIRLGRFGHFESKSIAGLRHGEKRGKNGRDGGPGRDAAFMTQGGSRTAARDASGCFLPFGWLILFDENNAPARPKLAALTAFSRPTSSSSSPESRPVTVASTAGMRFLKGERVTDGDETGRVVADVPNFSRHMEVDFGDGPENVSIENYWKAASK